MATWIQTVTARVPGIGLIAAEQYALLTGALVLLVMVALRMYLSRRIDCYARRTDLN